MLSRHWWLLALRGVIALLFGVLAFAWPGMTIAILVALFGAYVLVDGVFTTIVAVRQRTNTRWWLVLLEGVVGIAAGILTFFWPSITALVLFYLIAAWAVVSGVFKLLAAIQLRKEIANEWMFAISGIISILFGVLLMILPTIGMLALIWLIAAYAIVFGLIMLILAFQLRGWKEIEAWPERWHDRGDRYVSNFRERGDGKRQ